MYCCSSCGRETRVCELCRLALMRSAPKKGVSDPKRGKKMLEDINYPGLLETGGNAERKCRGGMQSERGGRARGRHHISNTIPTERLLERASRSASQSKTILKSSLSTKYRKTCNTYLACLCSIRFNQSNVCSKILLCRRLPED